jgi:hypothetical protein
MKKISIFLLFLLIPVFFASAEDLSAKLKGKILLQVQSHGEAWYVNPDSQSRFYLGRPADAFRVMREQGLGVSNKDFDSFAGTAPTRLAGKILLKVENKGEAYYVNPADLKMHYLGRPDDAFSIMKNLGLGITDSNLALISVDEKSSPIISKPAEEIKETPEEVVVETPEETATSTEEIVTPEAPQETATTTCVWLAEYFYNINLFGVPEATSTVNKIDFDWVREAPEGITKIDNFSVRYTANCYFEGGNYEFQTKYDDAIRVYLDNENFLQSWTDNGKQQIFNRERNISAGAHEVKVEYYDAAGNASISVDWVKLN